MGIRMRRSAAMAAAAITMAVLGACAGEAVEDPPPAQPSAEPSMAADGAEEEESPSEAPVEEEPRPEDDDPAPGSADWQTVEYGWSSFTVPGSWDVQYEQVDGQEVPRPAYGRGFCDDAPNEVLGSVIITWADAVTDPAEAVAAEAERAVAGLFGDRVAEYEIGEVLQDGPWASVPTAVQLKPSDDPCDGGEGMVVVKGVAYEDGSGTVLFIVVGELGLPDSPTPEDLVEIANSFGEHEG